MFSSVLGQNKSRTDWQEVARSAQFVSESTVTAAAAGIQKLPSAQNKIAQALLDDLAKEPATAASIKDGGVKVQATLQMLVDPRSAAEGQDPVVASVKRAALAVLHGQVYRAGQALRGKPTTAAVELLRAVSDAAASVSGSLGVQLTEEAREGLGHELYLAAARVIDPSLPGAPK